MADQHKPLLGPPSEERRAELEAIVQRMLQERSDALEAMRRRAGYSIDELAKAMGFKGSSSIQRYLTPKYDRGFRPEIARAFRRAFLGRGTPPITDDDLDFLLKAKMLEPTDPAWERHARVTRMLKTEKVVGAESLFGTDDRRRLRARLPLAEGDASIDFPRFLSPKSAEALKTWLGHLATLAEDVAQTYDFDRPADPRPMKSWDE